MFKVRKMIDQENGEDFLDSNPYFSPIFCGYLLTNWCGIIPLWTLFHSGDQSSDIILCRYPYTKPYLNLGELNVQKASKTQQNKSNKTN